MPKLGMEPIRRAALVKATIEEIGAHGSLDVTVARIAKRAGMSSALAHHYFGNKDRIFLAAMRHLLSEYSTEVREALIAAKGDPRARVAAILRANFGPSNFRPEVVAAWLNFYVLAAPPRPRRGSCGSITKGCARTSRMICGRFWGRGPGMPRSVSRR